MINLRYHIVSIVAVFLALGIGVALGSSFVDGFVVDTLRRNVDTLEDDRAQLREDVTELENQIASSDGELDAALAAVLPVNAVGRLTDTPVMVLASEGVDTAAWEQVRDLVVATDADYEGTLWLTDRLDMSVEVNRAALADTFGLVNNSESLARTALMSRLEIAMFPQSPEEIASVFGDVTGDVVGDLLEGDGTVGDDESEPASELASALVELRDAGFIRHDTARASTGALDEVPAFGTVFIIVSSVDAELPHDEFLYPLLNRAVEASAPNRFVAVEPSRLDEPAVSVSFVGPLRSDTVLRREISTIDAVDTFEGILALAAVADDDAVVHLGVSASATSRLPAS